jgi:hypothetical protein
MYLQDVIDTLKRIELSLRKFEDKSFNKCTSSLNRAIKILEDYKSNPGQLERQLPPNQTNLKGLPNQQKPDCGSGRHWVWRQLKNGKPGYCRKNPQRHKK